MATRTKNEIQAEIDAILETEVMVETNAGTYGAHEAYHKVRTGDPVFATRQVYQTVSGDRRATGPDERDAPGYMRQIGRTEMADLKSTLADLVRASAKRPVDFPPLAS